MAPNKVVVGTGDHLCGVDLVVHKAREWKGDFPAAAAPVETAAVLVQATVLVGWFSSIIEP